MNNAGEEIINLTKNIRGQYAGLLELRPDLPRELIKALEESDVKKSSIESPQVSDAFTELLWGVIGALVERKPELKKIVTDAGNIKITYEATDSPMKGHYELSTERSQAERGRQSPTTSG